MEIDPIERACWQTYNLEAPHRLILLALAKSSGKYFTPLSTSNIASLTGINIKNITKYLNQLEKLGLIEKAKLNVKDGSFSGYTFSQQRENLDNFII